ncbi:hypothetical protein QVD17_05737 [Tagetes erecta]|uniref:Uncharacterized protein n=1 Tax=Tagetes erecta TaxID=13708 RepID=A0AAD8LEE1_TARER|nr:hypothetical protein QVD17_05737 [Tagetes erecta]
MMTPSPATTPYATPPSTPHHTPNFFYSAPTTPIHDRYDFAFDYTGHLQNPSIFATADDLFHAGQIKTLNPLSFSPSCDDQTQTDQFLPNRGRETTTDATRTRGKASRSSSPFKISDILSEEDDNENNSPSWYTKFNLKNLLLFGSTLEGRARRKKNPVNKYSKMTKSDEDVKKSNFRDVRGVKGCSSGMGPRRRMSRKVSAHEMHYTTNRAAAEETRRKTYLPYKAGLLGCLIGVP